MGAILHLLPHAKASVMALNDLVIPSQLKKLPIKQRIIIVNSSRLLGHSRSYYTAHGYKIPVLNIGLLTLLLILLTTRKRRCFSIHLPRHLLFSFTKYLNSNSNFLCTMHNDYLNYSISHLFLFFSTKYIVSKTICVSSSVKQSMQNYYLSGLVISNSVPIEKIRTHSKREREVDLVIVGRFVKQKNVKKILKVVNCMPSDYKIVWVGDGILRDRVMSLCEHQNIDFIRKASREEIYETLGNSKCYLSLSLWEGIGVASLEAIAAECKVVLSDIMAHREILDSANAYVIPDEKTPSEISKDLCSIIDDFKLDAIAKDFMLEYENERMLLKYQDVYKEVSSSEK